MHSKTPDPALRWDIFCRVIDNLGDLGVCWRLACNLARRGQTVRLWADEMDALSWLAPAGEPGVEVRPWCTPIDLEGVTPGDAMIEAFGCEIDPEFIASYAYYIRARGQKSIWINLEYLTAEDFAARCHGLPSPVMSGPGAGLSKHFFYPGFTAHTGGLLREADLLRRQGAFKRSAWLAALGLNWQGERLVSLFCYEPAALGELLDTLANDAQRTCLLVTQGRASAAVQAEIIDKNIVKPLWNNRNQLSFLYLPQLTQTDFDHLLWASDVNFVRGEDSLVRALWAGKPLIWHIYAQDDGAHAPKLHAFLDWLQAPDSLRAFHDHWNCLDTPLPCAFAPQDWQTCMTQARARLSSQHDLVTQLLGFCAKNP